MSLKNLSRSIVLMALATVYAAAALAETSADLDEPPVKAALAKSNSDSQGEQSGDTRDELRGDILGVAASEPTSEPAPAEVDPATFKYVVVQPETSALPPSTKPFRQNGYGSMFGRIMRVDLDTNTVDIQFEGRRQTTVGSKFSVEHDYAFTTEYLGKLEIVYLAGGNRAIAKPGERTDISRMGKGDRVGGRVVPNPRGQSNGAARSGTGGLSGQEEAWGAEGWQSGAGSSAPSCVKPPPGKMPLPPPDPTIPYAPQGDLAPEEEPGPAPGITSSQQHAAPLAVRVMMSGPVRPVPREKWTGVTARSWDALIRPHRNSPATVLLFESE